MQTTHTAHYNNYTDGDMHCMKLHMVLCTVGQIQRFKVKKITELKISKWIKQINKINAYI